MIRISIIVQSLLYDCECNSVYMWESFEFLQQQINGCQFGSCLELIPPPHCALTCHGPNVRTKICSIVKKTVAHTFGTIHTGYMELLLDTKASQAHLSNTTTTLTANNSDKQAANTSMIEKKHATCLCSVHVSKQAAVASQTVCYATLCVRCWQTRHALLYNKVDISNLQGWCKYCKLIHAGSVNSAVKHVLRILYCMLHLSFAVARNDQ